MALVRFSTDLKKLTGVDEVRAKARTYRDLVSELVDRFEALDEETLMRMAVSIDGQLIHDPLLERFDATSEVIFLYRIAGG